MLQSGFGPSHMLGMTQKLGPPFSYYILAPFIESMSPWIPIRPLWLIGVPNENNKTDNTAF